MVLYPVEAVAARAEALLRGLDGLVLTGGGDLGPRLGGSSVKPTDPRVDELRDAFELGELFWV